MTTEFVLIDPDTDDDPIEELTAGIEAFAEILAARWTSAPNTGAEAYREGYNNQQARNELGALLNNAIDSRVAELVKERLSA